MVKGREASNVKKITPVTSICSVLLAGLAAHLPGSWKLNFCDPGKCNMPLERSAQMLSENGWLIMPSWPLS